MLSTRKLVGELKLDLDADNTDPKRPVSDCRAVFKSRLQTAYWEITVAN